MHEVLLRHREHVEQPCDRSAVLELAKRLQPRAAQAVSEDAHPVQRRRKPTRYISHIFNFWDVSPYTNSTNLGFFPKCKDVGSYTIMFITP